MIQELTVQDMTCGGCATSVRKALQQVPGVAGVEIDLPTHAVRVETAENVALETLTAAISEAGYTEISRGAAQAKQPTITLVGGATGDSCGVDGCC